MAPKVAKSQAKDKAKGKDKAKDQAKGKAKAQAGQKLPGPGPGGMEENLATVKTAEIELRPGEQDNANLPYIEKLAAAWSLIQDHDLFRDIQAAQPIGITGDAAASGTQMPFDFEFYEGALKTASKSYTAGINLFWIDLQWSATPGVPLRVSAIEQMARDMFRLPTAIGAIHIAVSGPEYNPLKHQGALLRVSPEEVTGAFVLAIARDIQNSEPDDILRAWKQVALSTTCVFKVLPSASDRYWYALQQREQVAMTHKAVHRSTLQRLHEISRLMKRLRETTPQSEVTAASIAKAYTDNLTMAAGAPGAVTLNFVDCCATIANKLLDVPAIAWCLQDLDERSALSEEPNPFDSHTRLQAIIDKCRANNQAQLVWVVQGIWYNWRRGHVKYLSVSEIKGTAQSGNHGFADMMLVKLQLKIAVMSKAKALFPESSDWFLVTVVEATDSFKSWFEHEEATDKSWRAGRPVSEIKFLNFLTEVVFGRAYDSTVKSALRASKLPEDTLNGPGIVEIIQEIEGKRLLEQQLAGPPQTQNQQQNEVPTPDFPDDITFRLPSKGGQEPTIMKASMVQDGIRREMLDSIIHNTRQNIAAQVTLIAQEPNKPHPHGLHATIMGSPLGKLRGIPRPQDPAKSKYIGVFYDPKVSGEANHRPMQRVPPLRVELVRRLLDIAKSRFGSQEGDGVPEGDLYFLFDGGKSGNQADLLKPFQSKQKTVKTFLLWRDEDSVTQRLQRVKGGIGSCRQSEQLHLVCATVPAVVPVKFQNFKGSSAGTMMGPIILPDYATSWQAPWP